MRKGENEFLDGKKILNLKKIVDERVSLNIVRLLFSLQYPQATSEISSLHLNAVVYLIYQTNVQNGERGRGNLTR